VRAVRAFAAATSTTFDDAAAAELEAYVRRAVVLFADVSRWCATTAEALQDPRVRQTLDAAIDGTITLGLRAGVWRVTLLGWLDPKETPNATDKQKTPAST
jgi:hypothetical protein